MINQLTERDYIDDPWPEFCEQTIKLGLIKGLIFKEIADYLINHKKEITKQK